jgi:hypothetical protein
LRPAPLQCRSASGLGVESSGCPLPAHPICVVCPPRTVIFHLYPRKGHELVLMFFSSFSASLAPWVAWLFANSPPGQTPPAKAPSAAPQLRTTLVTVPTVAEWSSPLVLDSESRALLRPGPFGKSSHERQTRGTVISAYAQGQHDFRGVRGVVLALGARQ